MVKPAPFKVKGTNINGDVEVILRFSERLHAIDVWMAMSEDDVYADLAMDVFEGQTLLYSSPRKVK